MATDAGRGTGRVLLKLQKSIEEGNHYEAHQMIRTLYFRYMTQNKHQDALLLVYNGATMLLKHHQEESGYDLCQLMLKCLVETDAPVNDENLEKITCHFQLFQPGSQNRSEYIAAAMSWTAKKNKEWAFGHPRLHLLCAETYWKEHNYGEAQSHFLHANNGFQCATMLVEYAVTCGYPSEADLFIAQAVLQKGNINQFTVLCEKYQPSLNRDPNYFSYLDKIGQEFFGLAPKPKEPSFNNFLGDLLQSFVDTESEGTEPVPEGDDLD